MRIGLGVDRFDASGEPASIGQATAATARQAEAAGFASLWVMDHFFQIPQLGPADDPTAFDLLATRIVPEAAKLAVSGR
jgi:alkanesulfonate monooxygenase SsuD/methylene tetrahydromethanopterin reductase-like flavin-dependent oxidoreductase (luciferase family)